MPDSIEDALELETLDGDTLFRSVRLWKPLTGRGVFGGQTLALSTWAATRSVSPELKLHSLHSYFLNFGDSSIPIVFHVDKIRDGRSYATRTVKAVQRGVAIFSLTASFQRPEPDQPRFAIPLPAPPSAFGAASWPPPEECTPQEESMQAELDERTDMPAKLREYLQRAMDERRASSIEIRSAKPGGSSVRDMFASREPQSEQAFWLRARSKSRDDPAFHKCVLAYASDMQFIGTGAKALGLSSRSKPKLAMMASLDHSMWFYSDVDSSQWHLYHMRCVRASSGRAIVHGELWTRDGRLVVVCSQEGVVRAQAPRPTTAAKL